MRLVEIVVNDSVTTESDEDSFPETVVYCNATMPYLVVSNIARDGIENEWPHTEFATKQ